MLVLNKIDLNLPLSVLSLRTSEGIEQVMLNELDQEDVTEDMVALLVDDENKTLVTDDGLVICEIITKKPDDGVYHLGTGVYDGDPLLETLDELDFTFVHHLGCHLPSDIKSVELNYTPVTPSPINFAQSLHFNKIVNEETQTWLAVSFSPKDREVNEMASEGDINIAFDNHMFYQFFGMVELPDGSKRFCSYDVPQTENFVNSLLTLQNDKSILEEISGMKLHWIGEDFKLTKVGNKFTIYSTVMFVYPYTSDTKILSYEDGCVVDEADNPFGLDEDSIDILMSMVGEASFGEIKLKLAESHLANIS